MAQRQSLNNTHIIRYGNISIRYKDGTVPASVYIMNDLPLRSHHQTRVIKATGFIQKITTITKEPVPEPPTSTISLEPPPTAPIPENLTHPTTPTAAPTTTDASDETPPTVLRYSDTENMRKRKSRSPEAADEPPARRRLAFVEEPKQQPFPFKPFDVITIDDYHDEFADALICVGDDE